LPSSTTSVPFTCNYAYHTSKMTPILGLPQRRGTIATHHEVPCYLQQLPMTVSAWACMRWPFGANSLTAFVSGKGVLYVLRSIVSDSSSFCSTHAVELSGPRRSAGCGEVNLSFPVHLNTHSKGNELQCDWGRETPPFAACRQSYDYMSPFTCTRHPPTLFCSTQIKSTTSRYSPCGRALGYRLELQRRRKLPRRRLHQRNDFVLHAIHATMPKCAARVACRVLAARPRNSNVVTVFRIA
jgi:hypothetical protein